MRSIVAFTVVAASVLATEHWFGAVGVTRLFGLMFIGGAVYACFAPSFSVTLGETEVIRLNGWYKLFAIVPTAAIGLAVAAYAPQIACISTKYKHLCA